MQTCWLVRDTAPVNDGAHRHVRDFDAINLAEM